MRPGGSLGFGAVLAAVVVVAVIFVVVVVVVGVFAAALVAGFTVVDASSAGFCGAGFCGGARGSRGVWTTRSTPRWGVLHVVLPPCAAGAGAVITACAAGLAS